VKSRLKAVFKPAHRRAVDGCAIIECVSLQERTCGPAPTITRAVCADGYCVGVLPH
jgi:hypothetical protein